MDNLLWTDMMVSRAKGLHMPCLYIWLNRLIGDRPGPGSHQHQGDSIDSDVSLYFLNMTLILKIQFWNCEMHIEGCAPLGVQRCCFPGVQRPQLLVDSNPRRVSKLQQAQRRSKVFAQRLIPSLMRLKISSSHRERAYQWLIEYMRQLAFPSTAKRY